MSICLWWQWHTCRACTQSWRDEHSCWRPAEQHVNWAHSGQDCVDAGRWARQRPDIAPHMPTLHPASPSTQSQITPQMYYCDIARLALFWKNIFVFLLMLSRLVTTTRWKRVPSNFWHNLGQFHNLPQNRGTRRIQSRDIKITPP